MKKSTIKKLAAQSRSGALAAFHFPNKKRDEGVAST